MIDIKFFFDGTTEINWIGEHPRCLWKRSVMSPHAKKTVWEKIGDEFGPDVLVLFREEVLGDDFVSTPGKWHKFKDGLSK